MYVYIDHRFWKQIECHEIHFRDANHPVKKITHNSDIFDLISISHVGKNIENTKENHIYALLDDEYFQICSFDIFHQTQTAFSIQELHAYIEEKAAFAKTQYHIADKCLFHYLDTIYVNWEKSQFLLWKTWILFFRLSFIFIKNQCTSQLRIQRWSLIQQQRITIYPHSFCTLDFLQNTLHKDSFYILYMFDSHIKLIHVQKWFYRDCQKMNLGIDMLKQIYKDNGIFEYFFAKKEDVIDQALTLEIIIQSVQFFVHMMCKWMASFIDTNNDLILLSPLSTNPFFQQELIASYKEHINWYILPFHSSPLLKDFWKKRSPDEMDLLVFLNTYEQIDRKII